MVTLHPFVCTHFLYKHATLSVQRAFVCVVKTCDALCICGVSITQVYAHLERQKHDQSLCLVLHYLYQIFIFERDATILQEISRRYLINRVPLK
jgi:hypothetical protein